MIRSLANNACLRVQRYNGACTPFVAPIKILPRPLGLSPGAARHQGISMWHDLWGALFGTTFTWVFLSEDMIRFTGKCIAWMITAVEEVG